jgi:hypothetical protein
MVKEQRWPLAWVKTKMVSRSNDDDAEAAVELVEVGLVGGKSAGAKTTHSHLGSGSLVATPFHLIVCLTNFLSHSSLTANTIYETDQHLESGMVCRDTRCFCAHRARARLGSVDLHDASSHASLAAELLTTLLHVPKPLAQVIQSSSRFV